MRMRQPTPSVPRATAIALAIATAALSVFMYSVLSATRPCATNDATLVADEEIERLDSSTPSPSFSSSSSSPSVVLLPPPSTSPTRSSCAHGTFFGECVPSPRNASIKCSSRSDACYETEFGVCYVSPDRYNRALRSDPASDVPKAHTAGFSRFAAFPKRLGHFLEIGCGTPLFDVRPELQTDSITTWDLAPLTSRRSCALNDAYVKRRNVVKIQGAIQDMRMREAFDTIFVVDAFERSRSAFETLDAVYAMLRPRGTVAIAERFFSGPLVFEEARPIKCSRALFESFASRFEELYTKDVVLDSSVQTYFVGRRRE